MILQKDKRGQFEQKIMFYLYSFFIIAFLLLLFGFFVYQMGSVQVATPKEIETFLYTQRFINSPMCFSASEQGFTTFLNSIDRAKFNQQVLDQCYAAQKNTKGKAFQLALKDASGNEIILRTVNWKDSAIITKRTKSVTILDNGKTVQGTFIMEFQNVE